MTAEELNQLGLQYWLGKEVERDYSKAIEFYTLAANQNYPTAIYNLGICYSNGQGVERNEEKAFENFLKSAELGYADGMFNVAIYYHKGIGTDSNQKECIKWMEKASKMKCSYACNFLGDRYFLGELGFVKNISRASEYYRFASIYGDPLGTLHYIGVLIDDNYYNDQQDYLIELLEIAKIQSKTDIERAYKFIPKYEKRILERTTSKKYLPTDFLIESPINVRLYDKNNIDVQKAIRDDYIKNGGYDSTYKREKETFYDEFDFVSDELNICDRIINLRIIQKGTRFGISSGIKILIQPIYLQIITLPTKESVNFACIDDRLQWGIPSLRNNKKYIVPFEFQCIRRGVENFYPVKRNGKWGVYYHHVQDEIDGVFHSRARRRTPQKSRLVIDCQYDDALYYNEGLCAVKKDGKWGYINFYGEIVIPFIYKSVTNFESGYAKVINEDSSIRIIDHNGIETHFSNLLLLDASYRRNIKIVEKYKNGEKTYQAEGPDGQIIIESGKYKFLGCYAEGLFPASLDGKHIGYIDINEKIIIPYDYQKRTYTFWKGIYSFKNGIVAVKTNNHNSMIINHKNENIFAIGFECENIRYSDSGTFSNDSITYSSLSRRLKRNSIEWLDIINYHKGEDMSYLIRTEEEYKDCIEKEREARRRRNSYSDYEWTDEDAWDAMTDGQYGDYPGSGWDPEWFGY